MARTALGPAESGPLLPASTPGSGIHVPAASIPRQTRGSRSCDASLSWPGLVRELRDPLIDDFSDSCRERVAEDAALCGMSSRDFDIQLRLHAPSVRDRLESRQPSPLLYDELRPRLVARCSRIAAYTEDADLLANSALLLGGGEARRGFTVRRPDGSSVGVNFEVVPPSTGFLYQSKLHYMLSPRADTIVELGCYLQGATHPVTYLAFSLCDRPGTLRALQLQGIPAERGNLLILTRALGLSGAARNLMSFTIGQAVRHVRTMGCKFIVTAFNPLLGFTGSALHASNFVPFATAPVAYSYDRFGGYVTRRRSTSDPGTDRRTTSHRNLLVVLGTDSTSRKETLKVTTLYDVAEPPRDAPAGHLDPLDSDELRRFRHRLEAAWSLTTAHPSYAREPLSSKGQCGVSSVWLARLLRKRRIEATYCYGRLSFDDPGISSVDHHCWLEIGSPNDAARQVVDLTCDQADGFDEKVIYRRHDELARTGVRYEPATRLTVDDLPGDRVWPRYLRLEESMRAQEGMENLYDHA
ncbi:transglutaminase domain-containing protein [Streptomyces sp. NPDC085614]|uniref:transglutaminase domain-containing protein n=1 Tax=Streptomyces sp. NPDC085614 TaxID=3365733 RepID=UPI0037D8A923